MTEKVSILEQKTYKLSCNSNPFYQRITVFNYNTFCQINRNDVIDLMNIIQSLGNVHVMTKSGASWFSIHFAFTAEGDVF